MALHGISRKELLRGAGVDDLIGAVAAPGTAGEAPAAEGGGTAEGAAAEGGAPAEGGLPAEGRPAPKYGPPRTIRLLPEVQRYVWRKSRRDGVSIQDFLDASMRRYFAAGDAGSGLDEDPPDLHGAAPRSVRLTEEMGRKVDEGARERYMRKSEFVNYVLLREMEEEGWEGARR